MTAIHVIFTNMDAKMIQLLRCSNQLHAYLQHFCLQDLHFKLEFLALFKVILQNKLLHKVRIQVVPNHLCTTKL